MTVTASREHGEQAARIAAAARTASRVVARAPAAKREAALKAVARALLANEAPILAANKLDVDAAVAAGIAPAMKDRLTLDAKRLAAMARALDEVAAQADPIGAIESMTTRPNGLQVGKMRIPLGVVLMIYEARPNVTTDAFALCLRAGNAVILRGGSEAKHTNAALGKLLAAGLEEAGLPPESAQVVPTDRGLLEALLTRDEEIDLAIPRGGEGLIRFVAEKSRVPVIRHYKGVCHVYVDRAADPAMALDICENAKVSRPGVCNACETILVHEEIAPTFVPKLVERLRSKNVVIRGDEATRRLGGAAVEAASDEDWAAEYLDLIVAVRVVPSQAEAIHHLERWGSSHTEAIVTRDHTAAMAFLRDVGSSTVIVNASTRFADGGELGLGAEIGISTSKLHAYGPMGAEGLTTAKFVVLGEGQVRP